MNIPNKTRFDESQMPLELVSLKMGEKVHPLQLSKKSAMSLCCVVVSVEVKQGGKTTACPKGRRNTAGKLLKTGKGQLRIASGSS